MPELLLIEFNVFADSRGYFGESYNQKAFHELGLQSSFIQDNISSSVQGTLRGIHYQLNPHTQGKLVRVTQGAVLLDRNWIGNLIFLGVKNRGNHPLTGA